MIINVKLPEKYRSRDKDGDGQIALYEWARDDLATFRKLDHNGDGFLTPRELIAGPRSDNTPGRSSTSRIESSPRSTSAQAETSPADSAGESKDPAQKAFDSLDRDKNGTVSEQEWRRSLSTRPKFEKAGIVVEFPLSRGAFLQLYPQAYATGN